MRSFVETFRAHLKDEGAPHDDEAVWQFLRRMQILVFDFAATGSASEEFAKERAARALHADDAGRAGNLWSELVELSIAIAKSGGDRTSEALKEDLGQKGLSFWPETGITNRHWQLLRKHLKTALPISKTGWRASF